MKKVLFTVGICLALVSCKKEDNSLNTTALGYDYYPEKIGTFVTYDVDSSSYNDFFTPVLVTNTKFQIKEKVESYFEDNLGRESMRIERYARNTTADVWAIADVWYATRTAKVLERVEDNLRFIKLVFPPANGITWRGNKYIDNSINASLFDEVWDYEIRDKDTPKTIGGITYDSTVTVIQKEYIDNDSRYSLIDKIYSKEIYAKGVGMVYKELWNVRRQDNLNRPWRESAEKGYIITYTAVAHGVE